MTESRRAGRARDGHKQKKRASVLREEARLHHVNLRLTRLWETEGTLDRCQRILGDVVQ